MSITHEELFPEADRQGDITMVVPFFQTMAGRSSMIKRLLDNDMEEGAPALSAAGVQELVGQFKEFVLPYNTGPKAPNFMGIDALVETAWELLRNRSRVSKAGVRALGESEGAASASATGAALEVKTLTSDREIARHAADLAARKDRHFECFLAETAKQLKLKANLLEQCMGELTKKTFALSELDEHGNPIPMAKIHRYITNAANAELWHSIPQTISEIGAELSYLRSSLHLVHDSANGGPYVHQQMEWMHRRDCAEQQVNPEHEVPTSFEKKAEKAKKRLFGTNKEKENGNLGELCPDLPEDIRRAAVTPIKANSGGSGGDPQTEGKGEPRRAPEWRSGDRRRKPAWGDRDNGRRCDEDYDDSRRAQGKARARQDGDWDDGHRDNDGWGRRPRGPWRQRGPR